MLFMVIERFEGNDMVPIYKRLEKQGRQLPEGLAFVDSWIEANFSRCFQLMECADARLLQEWGKRSYTEPWSLTRKIHPPKILRASIGSSRPTTNGLARAAASRWSLRRA